MRREALSLVLDESILPLPDAGPLSELVGALDPASPVAAGIATGEPLRRKAPGLTLHPDTSYLFVLSRTRWSIALDGKRRGQERSRNDTASRGAEGRVSVGIEPAFALDPCDPALFLAGVSLTHHAFTVELNGMGFSHGGHLHHLARRELWTGRNRADGSADFEPVSLDGHYSVNGGVSIGLGDFLSVRGRSATTLNLDPNRDGPWPLAEGLVLLHSGRPPSSLPDVAFLSEGPLALKLPGVTLPFANATLSVDARDPAHTRLRFGGELGPRASLASLFPGTPPPGLAWIQARAVQQVHGDAIFDARSPSPRGTYRLKLRGELNVGGLRVDGDLDLSYRDGAVDVCIRLPKLGPLCGAQIEKAARGLLP